MKSLYPNCFYCFHLLVDLTIRCLFSRADGGLLSTILDANGAKEKARAAEKLSKKVKKDVSHVSLTKREAAMAECILDPASLNVTFNMIGGLDHTIEEIKVRTIRDVKNTCNATSND